MIKCNTGNLIQKAVKAFLFSISSILSNQGNRNANDGIALAQTIEGALDETTNMLQRIRTLAVQAANGTNTEKDRKALQEEVNALSDEITRIAKKTTFAGAQVLDGGGAKTLMREVAGQAAGANPKKYEYFFQVGANAKDEISLQCGAFTMQGICSQAAISEMGRLTKANEKVGTDYEFAGLSKNGDTWHWVVSQPSIAQRTLHTIDRFIELVNSKRAALGAIQNRMESTIRNQSSISENESDARSRIRDTDFASETAALTQNQIIQQASQTILTQANQRPTVALNLLGQ